MAIKSIVKQLAKGVPGVKPVGKILEKRQSVFDRFPIMFTLLGTFGLVATLYGFEKLIDKVQWLANNPWLTLVVGLGLLIFTGSLYKRLG